MGWEYLPASYSSLIIGIDIRYQQDTVGFDFSVILYRFATVPVWNYTGLGIEATDGQATGQSHLAP
jgi:hypothetical protein